jgi:tRNA(fMet)-specific endonuclease VapC
VLFLFDTNHISVWQRGEGAQYERLCTHLEKHHGDQIYVSIVSFHELVNGWNAFSTKKRNSDSLVRTYFEFEKILRDFSVMQLVSFDQKAAEVFDDLNHKSLRVGSMDLRIASTAIANQMTLATQNSVDFERVPGLSIQNWLV